MTGSLRIYDCTSSRHAFREGPFRVESGAPFVVDVGDDEPMDCCTVADIQRRRSADPGEGMFADSVEFEAFLASLPDDEES